MHVWRQAASVSKQTLVGPSGFNVNRQCKMRDGVCYFVVNFFYNPSITMHVSPDGKTWNTMYNRPISINNIPKLCDCTLWNNNKICLVSVSCD